MSNDGSSADQPRAANPRRLHIKAKAGAFKVGPDVPEASEKPEAKTFVELSFEEVEAARRAFEVKAAELIFTFAQLERSLFELFKKLLGKDERIAAALFYRNNQFSGRLSLIDDMIDVCIADQDAVDRWHKISGELEEIAECRNIVAHQPFGVHRLLSVGLADASHKVFLGAAYAPSERWLKPQRGVWFEPKNRKSKTGLAKRIDIATLEGHLTNLAQVQVEFSSFIRDLIQNPKWFGRRILRT